MIAEGEFGIREGERKENATVGPLIISSQQIHRILLVENVFDPSSREKEKAKRLNFRWVRLSLIEFDLTITIFIMVMHLHCGGGGGRCLSVARFHCFQPEIIRCVRFHSTVNKNLIVVVVILLLFQIIQGAIIFHFAVASLQNRPDQRRLYEEKHANEQGQPDKHHREQQNALVTRLPTPIGIVGGKVQDETCGVKPAKRADRWGKSAETA